MTAGTFLGRIIDEMESEQKVGRVINLQKLI
jgi:hypothetical protein